MRLAFVLATVLVAFAFAVPQAIVPQAMAASSGNEGRWCTVNNPGLGNIQWDCRYATLAACAATVGASSSACLENPNWQLPRPRPVAR